MVLDEVVELRVGELICGFVCFDLGIIWSWPVWLKAETLVFMCASSCGFVGVALHFFGGEKKLLSRSVVAVS